MTLLGGCRVLDLGIITAGAATSALLADFGAEVVKVESPTYRDPFRIWGSDAKAHEPGDMPPHFRATNRNKLAISIDLKREEGREIFLRLVRKADVVVENFRRGVLENLGLSFDVLRSANPRIVLASISSQGETGPDADQISYGSTLEALSGLAWVTGYAGGKPEVSGRDVNYPDQIVAMFAAGMIATALRSVREDGTGVHLDISQRDLAAFLLGDRFVAASTGQPIRREGNADTAAYVLQDCFRAADGRWVAVTVQKDDDVPGLFSVEPPLETENPCAVRAALAGEIGARPAGEAVESLSKRGVRLAQVLNGSEVLAARGALWNHAMLGAEGAMVKGFPLQVDEAPLKVRYGAPAVGQDTTEILHRLGGYSMVEIQRFADEGIIEQSANSG